MTFILTLEILCAAISYHLDSDLDMDHQLELAFGPDLDPLAQLAS